METIGKLVPARLPGTARIRNMTPANTTPDYPLRLLCHPATAAPVVRLIEARALLRPNGHLDLAFCLRGDMARLLIPTEPSADRNLLWEHTCFEAFVSVAGGSTYREFNFSPSGQWAFFAFSDYRLGDDTLPPVPAPQITSRLYAGRLELEAILAPEALPCGKPLRIGLSAVVEAADTIDGSHSYWALRHPAAHPDFHHRDSFAFELANPRQST